LDGRQLSEIPQAGGKMSFVWVCKCGQVISDKRYLSYGKGIRELIRCVGRSNTDDGYCKHFLSDYRRMSGKDDFGKA